MEKMFFKFRSINTKDDIIRFMDIINNNRLFFPKYNQLNDPLEGSGYSINLGGYAGCGISLAADREDKFLKEEKEKYRILSLSDNCFSPQLWAHYANTYSGLCIGFWTNKSFINARGISYINESILAENTNEYGFVDNWQNAVKESFFYKHYGWAYEREFRIVEKSEQNYFYFNSSELACIIIGNNMNNDCQRFIQDNIRSDIPIYISYPGFRTFRINLINIDYSEIGLGEKIQFIYTIDNLVDDIKKRRANKKLK